MSEPPHRDVAIFTEALRLPAGERAAYLTAACGGDPVLRQQVEALLQSHVEAGGFMASAALPVDVGSIPAAASGEKLGDRIGRYKLLQQIGEGGCGVVYMAEQEEPVRRRVALKVIKAGMDTKSVIARFEAERQALALMDHPNIAKVLDAGATESGRPYFVMELVRGVKITTYCDEHALTTEERLHLFIQVCQAVQHAHQKGIIHRDLKPSNILVTQTLEGAALPVVIDFGIAKATTNQPLTDKTLFTAFEMLIGTPAYMSPEQAALTSVDVDTRTDIYSLGVLLYELLTGSTPFDAGVLLKAGLDEIRRVIREDEPVRPSTRLSKLTNPELTTVAHRRHAEPPALLRMVRGDLDWIAMKALEKNRVRRYETANGLARDIQRYLANETVSARPPSAAYRFQKTVLRHKLLFGAIGVVAVLLVASLVLISVSLARERAARQQADAALRQAEIDNAKATAEAAKSGQVTKFLGDMLQGVGPSVAQGRDTTLLREILEKAAQRLDSELADQPATKAELQNRIGSVYQELAIYDHAEAMHQAALSGFQKLSGIECKEAAGSLTLLGQAYFLHGDLVQSERAYREALRIRRKLLGNDDPEVATTLKGLAGVYYRWGKTGESLPLVQESLAIRRKRFGNESREVADSLSAMAVLYSEQGKLSEAEATCREALALRRKLLGPEHPLTVVSLHNLGSDLSAEFKLAEAEACARAALALRRKLYGMVHPDCAQTLHGLGYILQLQGRFAESEAAFREACDIERKVAGDSFSWLNAEAVAGLRNALEAEGKWSEAEELARQRYDVARKAHASEAQVAGALQHLVPVLASQRKFAEAERFLAEYQAADGAGHPPSSDYLRVRADYLARRGRWSESLADATSALAAAPTDYQSYELLVPLLVATRDTSKYESLGREILGKFDGTATAFIVDRMALDCLVLPSPGVDFARLDRMVSKGDHVGLDESSLHYHQCGKALSEYRQGRYARAIDWAQQAIRDARPEVQAMAQAVLAMAYQQQAQISEARAALAAAMDLVQHYRESLDGEDLGATWRGWVFAQALLNQATAVVGSPRDQ